MIHRFDMNENSKLFWISIVVILITIAVIAVVIHASDTSTCCTKEVLELEAPLVPEITEVDIYFYETLDVTTIMVHSCSITFGGVLKFYALEEPIGWAFISPKLYSWAVCKTLIEGHPYEEIIEPHTFDEIDFRDFVQP